MTATEKRECGESISLHNTQNVSREKPKFLRVEEMKTMTAN
jgi:hypothetical protein